MRLAHRVAAALALCSIMASAQANTADAASIDTIASGLQFPEGTVFVADVLYFVDYATSDVLRIARDGSVQKVWHGDGCGANGLVARGTHLLVACYDSGTIAEIALDGRLVDTLRADANGQPFVHPNDLTADTQGGVYFSASGSADTPGKVYYIARNRTVREVATDIRYSNGLAIAPDGKTLYVAESAAARVLSFAIGAHGALGARHTFVELGEPGGAGSAKYTPDALRTDRNGNLFVALYDGGGVAVFSSRATLLNKIALPAQHHSNLAISADGEFLFVTSIDEEPGGNYRGGLLKVRNPLAPR
jgi:gluconolactonase